LTSYTSPLKPHKVASHLINYQQQSSTPITTNQSTSTSSHLTTHSNKPTNPPQKNVLLKLGTTLPRQIHRQLFPTRNSHIIPTTTAQRIPCPLETQCQIQWPPNAQLIRLRSGTKQHISGSLKGIQQTHRVFCPNQLDHQLERLNTKCAFHFCTSARGETA
jgi:hypothetical protein